MHIKIVKVYDINNDYDDYNGQQTNFDQKKLTWAFSSGELKL